MLKIGPNRQGRPAEPIDSCACSPNVNGKEVAVMRASLKFVTRAVAGAMLVFGACSAHAEAPFQFWMAPTLSQDGRPQQSAIPRETIAYRGPYAPGTILVSTRERRLYFVLPGGQAIRYGVGVGRPGFEWSGTKQIVNKREWPDWTPPIQMLHRRPDLPRHMAGGIDNPLGARALYIGGTMYRIHGSNEPDTIGQAVSSGCIRMTNDDVVDLYGRVRIGTRVVVLR
jgi:lipoprotein-anchoring transpeptidase ErfK/SrfK